MTTVAKTTVSIVSAAPRLRHVAVLGAAGGLGQGILAECRTQGIGAREMRAVADALGRGALSTMRWTLVRGGLNARGIDEAPVASADWAGARNSWMPVSYRAMARWLLEEAVVGRYVRGAPLVSRARR